MLSQACVKNSVHGGACMVNGDVRGKRGLAMSEVVCMVKRGMCGGGACMTGETATPADGTHPTGMHSCCKCMSLKWAVRIRFIRFRGLLCLV